MASSVCAKSGREGQGTPGREAVQGVQVIINHQWDHTLSLDSQHKRRRRCGAQSPRLQSPNHVGPKFSLRFHPVMVEFCDVLTPDVEAVWAPRALGLDLASVRQYYGL